MNPDQKCICIFDVYVKTKEKKKNIICYEQILIFVQVNVFICINGLQNKLNSLKCLHKAEVKGNIGFNLVH